MSVERDRLAKLPTRPGVYLFRDDRGEVLYVGKAKSLRPRVRSYFQRAADLSAKNRELMKLVDDVETIVVGSDGEALILNCLTPHGKWHIHSTYMENHRMLTLSRGCEPVWMSEVDAEAMGIQDNDWVEVYNDHGVYCARACVSARIPKGVCIVYHVPERTGGIPKSQVRGGKRAQ